MLLAAEALFFTLPPGVALVLWLIIIVSIPKPLYSATSSITLYDDIYIRANVIDKGDCIPYFNPNL